MQRRDAPLAYFEVALCVGGFAAYFNNLEVRVIQNALVHVHFYLKGSAEFRRFSVLQQDVTQRGRTIQPGASSGNGNTSKD